MALPERYARLRAERPVCQVRPATGHLAWLVTRWHDVRFVLADRRFSKAMLVEPGSPSARPGALPAGLLMTTDPPEHTELRAIVKYALNGPKVEGLRPGIARIADALIDRLVAGRRPADFLGGFAEPFAMRVMCDLLGVPLGDRSRFGRWAERVLAVDGRSAGVVERAQSELFAYMARLARTKSRRPGDDLISAMLAGPVAVDAGSVTTLAATLLVTGYETMVAAVANSVLTLLLHPRGVKLLMPPAERAPVLEELLRFATFGDAMRSRRVTEDVRIADVLVRKGDLVLVSTASANRDETVFADGDRFDPGRQGNRHLSFGHGVHYCVGAALARAELDIALERLAARLPDLRLAVPPEEITLRLTSAESPPENLPVTW